MVDEIEPMRPITSLIHLGLSYNCLTADALPSITQSFPKLFCLNLSFNQICDIKKTLQDLEKLDSIRMLYLAGNPIQLISQYR